MLTALLDNPLLKREQFAVELRKQTKKKILAQKRLRLGSDRPTNQISSQVSFAPVTSRLQKALS